MSMKIGSAVTLPMNYKKSSLMKKNPLRGFRNRSQKAIVFDIFFLKSCSEIFLKILKKIRLGFINLVCTENRPPKLTFLTP